MGYSFYFAVADRDVVAKVYGMSRKDIVEYAKTFFPAVDIDIDSDGNPWVGFHDLLQGMGAKRVYDFGKGYDNAEELTALGTPMFLSDSTLGMVSEYDPYIVGKDAMLNAIGFYRKKALMFFESLLLTQQEMEEAYGRGDFRFYDEKNKTREERLVFDVKRKINEWSNFPPYSLSLTNDAIVDSGLYEYAIFELARLYKTIDWEKQCLIFYGS